MTDYKNLLIYKPSIKYIIDGLFTNFETMSQALKKHENNLAGVSKTTLVEIPEESVWLANFISEQTQKTYKNAVSAFIQYSGIQHLEELRNINQANILSWRDSLIKSGASNRTVNNRMSALSSLFNHLCEKQLVATNPVKGLKRPKVNQKTVKTPALFLLWEVFKLEKIKATMDFT